MLVLASASPRRHELLRAAGIPHRVQPTGVPEIQQQGEDGIALARRLAFEKASVIPLAVGEVALGADTVVCLADEVMGKPLNELDGARMLARLSGQRHWVHTGICLKAENELVQDLASTAVDFVDISEDEISEYARSGEGNDKAGGYAIQGLASRFACRIEGCYHNVVGLPVSLVYRHLRKLGYL